MKSSTPRTITSKKKLIEEIEKTRKRGYSICDRELSMDLFSIGVNLIDSHGEGVSAVNATMSAHDSENRMTKMNVIETLIQEGEKMSNALGYNGAYPFFPNA